MNWNGEEYSRRLRGLSKDTMQMIAKLCTTESILKAAEIIMENDSEKIVAEKLRLLGEQKNDQILPATEEEWQERKRKAKEEYLEKLKEK